MLANLFNSPLVWIALAVFVFLQWDRIKPLLDKLRGVTADKPSPTVADTFDGIRATIRETLSDWINGELVLDKNVTASAVGNDATLEGLTTAENALDNAVHNWLMLRRSGADTKKLDELFASFPSTYLDPKTTNAT